MPKKMQNQNLDIAEVDPLKTSAIEFTHRFYDSTDSESVYPKDWPSEAAKAWIYYRTGNYPRGIIDAFITLSFGDGIYVKKSDDSIKTEDVKAALKAKKILRHLKQQLKQLLVKGDMVGYWDADLEMARQVNPVSCKPKYEKGVLVEIKQFEAKISKTGKATLKGTGTSLSTEDIYHERWDAADYDAHGNGLLLAAFEDIELLKDLRSADRAVAKRWANPFIFMKVGGIFGNKLIKPTQAMIDDVVNTMNEGDKRSIYAFPFYVDPKMLGTEGEVLDTDGRKKTAQEGIAVACNFPRTLLTGDGATFSTARAAAEKLALMLDEIRAAAWRYLNWLFAKVLGKEEDEIDIEWGHNGFSQFSGDEFKRVVGVLVEQGVIGRRTAQSWLNLNPDEEAEESAKDEIRIKSFMSMQDIVGLVTTGVLTADEGRAYLGLGELDEAQKKQTEGEVDDIYEKTPPPEEGEGED